MLVRLGRHLTYANVVSTLCLFAVLGGSAYAAAKITGKDVKNASLTGADVRNNSLTGRDVRNHSLTKKDIKGKLRGPRGPAGTNGSNGATGPTGPNGTAGATNVTIRMGNPVSFDANSPANVSVSCANGERAVGGGINVAGEPDGNANGVTQIVESYPTPATAGAVPTGWAGAVQKNNVGTDSASAYVVCASP